MTVERNYVIEIATLSDGLKRLAPVFLPVRSKTKTKRTMYTSFFPRFERVTGNFYRDCDWFIALCAPVVIGRSDYLGFGFSTVIGKPLYTNLFWFVIIIIISFIFTTLTIIFTLNEN